MELGNKGGKVMKVRITETLCRVVEVASMEEAMKLYKNEDIVLDYNDFVGNDFEEVEEDE